MDDVLKYLITVITAHARLIAENFCLLAASHRELAVCIIQITIYLACGIGVWLIGQKITSKKKNQPKRTSVNS